MSKRIFPLSKVTEALENLITKHIKDYIWIKAEIVRLNYYKKTGHCYPDLVEKKDGKTIAEIKGTIWRSKFIIINKIFKDELGEELSDNMTVVLYGKVTYSSIYGLTLDIADIDPKYTLGELAKQKAETIERLKKEQVFDLNKKTVLAMVPKVIAIISVESSMGFKDFINVIENNSWNYKYHYHLFTATLQGEKSPSSIVEQLKKIEQYKDVFDVVTILRGGGGEIGLSSYDNYELAKTIATFPIPVLTGIGHSANLSVADMVAYQSFITPTKIGEFLLQEFHNFAVPLQEATVTIEKYFKHTIEIERSNIKETGRLFQSLTNRILDNQKQNFTRFIQTLNTYPTSLIKSHKSDLSSDSHSIYRSTTRLLQIQSQKLNLSIDSIKKNSSTNINQNKSNIQQSTHTLERNTTKHIQAHTNQLSQTIQYIKGLSDKKVIIENNKIKDKQTNISKSYKIIIENATKSLTYLSDKVGLLDPNNVLKRGFSITRLNGKAITEGHDVSINDTIETQLYQGKLISKIESKEQE